MHQMLNATTTAEIYFTDLAVLKNLVFKAYFKCWKTFGNKKKITFKSHTKIFENKKTTRIAVLRRLFVFQFFYNQYIICANAWRTVKM